MARQLKMEVVDIADIDTDTNNSSSTDESVGSDSNRITKCQACGKPAKSRHFGPVACRACGAFFRRSIVINKRFYCRCLWNKYVYGNGIVDRSLSFSGRTFCRACRLKRCMEIGMRPEAVRAIQFRATTNLAISLVRETSMEDERQEEKLPKIEPSPSDSDSSISAVPKFSDLDSFYLNLLLPLLPLESRMHRIFSSTTLLPNEHYDKFQNIGDLIDYNENMLDQYSKFSTRRFACWARMQAINFMERNGFWKSPQQLGRFLGKLLLAVDMIKSLPVFSQLELDDQKAVLKDSVRKCTQFYMAYFSLNVNDEAIVWDDGTNIFEIFSAVARHYKSDLMINAAHNVFIKPMTEMSRVRPSKEEFVLLLAMLVANPASPGLSEKAKLLLNSEAEKYGKILMQYEQNLFGQSAGVLRYMELHGLIWNAITCTHKVREMYAYFDTVLDQGCFNKAFSPVFRQLALG